MVRLYGDLIRYSGDTQEMLPLQVVNQPAAKVVPPFLIKTSRRSG
jgi:hypothetical protein